MNAPVEVQRKTLTDDALDQLFRAARTYDELTGPVTDTQLRAIYDLMKFGPTTANSQPLRIVFVRSAAAKARLAPALSSANRGKTMRAPVTAILAYDTRFYEHLVRTFPHKPEARTWFEGRPQHIETTALRNSSLQGAYFMLAARAVGLDCGPMSGFDNAKVDAEFFPDGRFKSNFICNLGCGDPGTLAPRNPRFDFDEVCRIA
ncbi:MAG: malonic semialdehyde reductase [Variibacter sp.]|nr:malonic semialdehyde reductase [Variibacter sp.]